MERLHMQPQILHVSFVNNFENYVGCFCIDPRHIIAIKCISVPGCNTPKCRKLQGVNIYASHCIRQYRYDVLTE